MDNPLAIVYEMIKLIFLDSIDTSQKLSALFIQLLHSLGSTVATGGPVGAIIAIVILVPVLYCASKLLGDNLKNFLIAGFVILVVFLIASGFA